jgi:hypothetical protein
MHSPISQDTPSHHDLQLLAADTDGVPLSWTLAIQAA